jgi:hypothetical protein
LLGLHQGSTAFKPIFFGCRLPGFDGMSAHINIYGILLEILKGLHSTKKYNGFVITFMLQDDNKNKSAKLSSICHFFS